MHKRGINTKGFTLVELSVVLIIIGILISFAKPRFFDARMHKASEFYNSLLSDMRYAQSRAFANGCFVKVSYNTSTKTFTFEQDASSNCSGNSYSAMTSPLGAYSFTTVADANTTVTVTGSLPLYFNAKMALVDDDDLSSMTATNLTVAVSDSDLGFSQTMNIVGASGYMYEN